MHQVAAVEIAVIACGVVQNIIIIFEAKVVTVVTENMRDLVQLVNFAIE